MADLTKVSDGFLHNLLTAQEAGKLGGKEAAEITRAELERRKKAYAEKMAKFPPKVQRTTRGF